MIAQLAEIYSEVSRSASSIASTVFAVGVTSPSRKYRIVRSLKPESFAAFTVGIWRSRYRSAHDRGAIQPFGIGRVKTEFAIDDQLPDLFHPIAIIRFRIDWVHELPEPVFRIFVFDYMRTTVRIDRELGISLRRDRKGVDFPLLLRFRIEVDAFDLQNRSGYESLTVWIE